MMASTASDQGDAAPARDVWRYIRSASPRARLLAGVWLLFALLVAAGIHGSSTALTAGTWMPEKPYRGFLFEPAEHPDPQAKISANGVRSLLLANPRFFRWDEAYVTTPAALSQMAQHPRFPVVNPSYGNGQNMLVSPHVPVWHVATLARPATWGYFFLGAQRGLAWYWWFQPLACFTALFLLLEIVCGGDWKLAALGALLFGTSAYVVLWSLWPAHVTFFAALACLAAYHLCRSDSRRVVLTNALLLGLSLPGFVMFMYPPWQVPLAYLFLLLFAALFIRDRLHLSLRPMLSYRLASLGLAAALAGGLTLAWVVSCQPALHLMAKTVYPGKRFSTGGDGPLALLLRGIYNVISCNTPIQGLRNESESASFYYFFPAIFLALPFSRRLARGLGVVGWAMIVFIAAMVLFLMVGVPAPVARLTLMRYVPGNRADLAIGLASIILSLYVLSARRAGEGQSPGRLRRWGPLIASAGFALLIIVHSLFLLRLTGDFPVPSFALMMAFLLAIAAYHLLEGKRRQFAVMILTLQFATVWLVNPLATNLDHYYDSELGKEVARMNRQSRERPFWIVYGGTHVGQLIAALGGKAMTGIQWPPQLALWRNLDPDGRNEATYNRYAEISFNYTNDDHSVSFENPQDGTLIVTVSPTNPELKAMGVRYVLLMGEAQTVVDASRLSLLYRSSFDNFSIYEIP